MCVCACAIVGQYCIFDRSRAASCSIVQACVLTRPGPALLLIATACTSAVAFL